MSNLMRPVLIQNFTLEDEEKLVSEDSKAAFNSLRHMMQQFISMQKDQLLTQLEKLSEGIKSSVDLVKND